VDARAATLAFLMAMVSNRHHASSSSTASGVLQDRSVEAFGEPAVDRRKQVAGFGALALIAPQAGEAGGGAQLPDFRTLPLRDLHGLIIVSLSRRLVIGGIQQIPSQPM